MAWIVISFIGIVMFSYITFKATRVPQIVESELTLQAAISEAERLYEHCKILSNHELLASGVSVLVLSDADALKAAEDGTLMNLSLGAIKYQCGGF